MLYNFIDQVEYRECEKKDYVLYFGRFSREKGIHTLVEVCKKLPEIKFIFAGTGDLQEEINGIDNIQNVGFQTGENLERLIREARFSVCPSEWYEPFGLSIVESQVYRTPVVGAKSGGIPELIEDGVNGRLFESGNVGQLAGIIEELWNDPASMERYSEQGLKAEKNDLRQYSNKLMEIYAG